MNSIKEKPKPLPVADGETGLKALKGLIKQRSLLPALEAMHEDVGDAFKITMPVFQPAVLVGPESNRNVLVSQRKDFLWRTESDPVTHLLRKGILVLDGQEHDDIRAEMDPILVRKNVTPQIAEMWRYTKMVTDQWQDGQTVDMLVEMRKVALLILMGVLFKVEFKPDIDRMWDPILKTIKYISPGPWILWANMPRPGYKKSLQVMDDYLYGIIRERRQELAEGQAVKTGDLLGHLIEVGMDDDLIRDQLLTMLIAGHDTSTAQLSWGLYLLGRHTDALQKAQDETDANIPMRVAPTVEQLNQLNYLELVNKETLRLYPPIHIGNRKAGKTMDVQGYEIEEGMRVMYSIYLAHRDKKYWPEPNRFLPERFDRQNKIKLPPFTYLPFGGGPRNCIGAAFSQVEAKVVLSHILREFELNLEQDTVRTYMGATLEPRPGVLMRVKRRSQQHES